MEDAHIGGFLFKPLITGPQLAEIGSPMGNCLATYWTSDSKATPASSPPAQTHGS